LAFCAATSVAVDGLSTSVTLGDLETPVARRLRKLTYQGQGTMEPAEADDLLSQYEAGLSEIADHADDSSLTPRERIELIRDTLDDVFGSDDDDVEFDGPDYDPDEVDEE
jgi:hypothetical protein